MPEAIPGWKTSDDKLHTNYLAALKHEFMLWLAQVGENEVGAKKIVECLTKENIDEIVAQLQAIQSEIRDPASFKVSKNVDSQKTEQA